MKSIFDLDHQNKSLDARIVAGLERLSAAFRVMIWEQAKEYSLSPIQIQVLIFLNYHTRKLHTVSYLAKELNVTKPTISDAVKALEQKKRIRKIVDSNDTRSYAIELTAAGKKVVEKTEQFALPIQQLISTLSETRKEVLWETISHLIFQLYQHQIISVQRTCMGCRFFRKGKQNFCTLLEMPLAPTDIRIDCPEFEEV